MCLPFTRFCFRFRRARALKGLVFCVCFVTILSILLTLDMRHSAFFLRQFSRRGDFYLHTGSLENVEWLGKMHALKHSPGQKCVHPDLDPFEPSIIEFYTKEPDIDCSSSMEDWVYVNNGTFHVSRRAQRLYGKITCEYAPLVRADDFSTRHAPHINPMMDGMAISTDFFKVACMATGGRKYLNIHAAVSRNDAVHQRLQAMASQSSSQTSSPSEIRRSETPGTASLPLLLNTSTFFDSKLSRLVLPPNYIVSKPVTYLQRLNLSVFMFGFDSLSRMAWRRLLPRTREYFLESLGGLELEGYNIVGDGTPAALLPILTGRMEEELPEARRGFSGAKHVDGHPWVWKDFKRHGYVTAYAEDMAHIGTFQYRMLGFKEQPTDHYMRTFYLAAQQMYKNNRPFCLGSKPRHVNFMSWFDDLFEMYRTYPKFFFGFHSELSHDSNNKVQAVDRDFAEFLSRLETNGHLNSTLLILMADHGARYSYIRATSQGRLEERMPYFALRFPPWFRQQHPDLTRNLQINSYRLTSPFDIHQTFLEILDYSGSGLADISKRGISLFKEIPKERTCSDAGVAPHWCACLDWRTVNQSDSTVRKAVHSAIDLINSYTEKHRASCALLSVVEITRSSRYTPSYRDFQIERIVHRYSKSPLLHSSEYDNNMPKMPSWAVTQMELYQISFITQPGRAHFEITCTLNTTSGVFSINGKDISRINKYGLDPQCVQTNYPHLRPYCYCLNKLLNEPI